MKTKSVLFIHRSVGQNLIGDGKLEEEVMKASKSAAFRVDFMDINNNLNKDLPGEDTKPEDYLEYFKNHAIAKDLVVIKSCYPNNHIDSDYKLNKLKDMYSQLVSCFINKSPGKLLILTTPPLRPLMTNEAEATRARALASWLSKQKFNNRVRVFDFYNLLSAEVNNRRANRLKRIYRRILPFDNHPNVRASKNISPFLAKEIVSFLTH